MASSSGGSSCCCSCNGVNAKCIRCVCVKRGTPCVSCLPRRMDMCRNTLVSRQAQVSSGVTHVSRRTGTSLADETSSGESSLSSESLLSSVVRVDRADGGSSVDQDGGIPVSVSDYSQDRPDGGHSLESNMNVKVDQLMLKAFGVKLIHGDGIDPECLWYRRWRRVVDLQGKQYYIPGGSIGRKYVDALSDEVTQVSCGNYPTDRLVVFSAFMLQRDKMIKKTNDIRRVLERRLKLWKEQQFDVLMQEVVRCDKALKGFRALDCDKDHITKVFTRLMLVGKVKSAIRWLSEKAGSGMLKPNDIIEVEDSCGTSTRVSVIDVLRGKHPDPIVPPTTSLLECDVLPLLEEVEVTGGHVLHVAKSLQGGAGPGGCDSSHWQDCLLRFGAHSGRLRESVASLCRRLANSIVPWTDIRALVANRLIALDKCPGVRPIGIGECLRRVLGKAICLVTRIDMEEAAGISQLCAGTRAGIEGAIHAVNDLFEENKQDGWGVLLVDAANAFNSLNRSAALWNARIIWPRCAKFLFNTYRGWAALVTRGSSGLLFSREGVTQGDPLSMFFYAAGTLPLIDSLRSTRWKQVWYADDASACGKINDLRDWFGLISEKGPSFGYFPQPKKTYLVVDRKYLLEAEKKFGHLGIQVVCCRKFLGGVIGDEEGKKLIISKMSTEWVSRVENLTRIALTQPQAAFAAFTKSLQFTWAYAQRVMPECKLFVSNLENVIRDHFLPAVTQFEISQVERDLFALPARLGGLGVENPTKTCDVFYSQSRRSTEMLVGAIKDGEVFEVEAHNLFLMDVQKEMKKNKESVHLSRFEELICQFDVSHQRVLNRAKEGKVSAWLTVLPLAKSQFDLAPREFRDALAIRYKRPLLDIPATCDGCGALFCLEHALSCKKGGLIVRRHNEVRDFVGDLANLAWSSVRREPIVREANEENGSPALIADLAVRGVWLPQTEALLDIRVVDTDARSYGSRSPKDILRTAEREKKNKYGLACEERRGMFTPFCCSVDGLMGNEADVFLKRLGDVVSVKWERSYSEVMGWVRARLSFAILRASILCLRGSRVKWRCLGLEDGASIGLG